MGGRFIRLWASYSFPCGKTVTGFGVLMLFKIRVDLVIIACKIHAINILHYKQGYMNTISDMPAKPFLRWAGSKRQLVPKLKSYWSNDYHRYVEPFAGSACLFFALKPKNALLSDTNRDLIITYLAVKDHPRAVYNRLNKIPIGEKSYYRVRSQAPENLDDNSRAARFIYLNRFCFNGLYRTNLKGDFNVPYAKTGGTGELPTYKQLSICSTLLKNAKIQACDFSKTILNVKSGDFVYMDPPFAVSQRRVFNEYGPKTFSLERLEDLIIAIDIIHAAGAYFVVSYADCTEAREIFEPWNVTRVRTRRNISGFSTNRRNAYELIATNIL